MSTPSNLTRGYTSALICAALLSTTAIFIRYLTVNYHIPPLVLAFWRDVFTVCTLLPVLVLIRPGLLGVNSRNLRYLALYGLVLSIFNAFWTISVAVNGAAVATVLVYCSAAFSVLLGRWFLNERLNWAKVLSIILCLSGCVLVAEASDPAVWRANFGGILTGVISGLCYTVYSLMGRSAAQRGLSPWTTLLYTFGFAAIFLLCLNLLPGGIIPDAATRPADFWWLGNSAVGWGILFLLAAGPTLVGFGLYNVSLVYLPAGVVNLIATLEPAFTTVIAYFLLSEKLSGAQIFGSIMILAGVVLLRMKEEIMKDKSRSLKVQRAQSPI